MKNSWKFLLWMIVWWWLLYLYFANTGTLPWVHHETWSSWLEFSMNGESSIKIDDFDVEKQFKKYNWLYELLDKTYYDKEKLDVKKMQENALKWFIDAIGDPYTVYLTEDENKVFDEWMQGSQEFEGIGAIVTKKEDGILIENVLKGSPAFEAWILPLDLILQIDGEPTGPLWLNEWVELIRWEKWTEVVLTIFREGKETTIHDITVTRWEISVPSVEWELIKDEWKNILHLTVSVFWDDTIRVLQRVIKEYSGDTIDWVILDLRWNGWWYLPIAIELASFFLPKNEIVTTAKYTIFDDEVFRSKWYKTFQGIPTVVLIDALSASASEIVASALKERWDATLIWKTTFGKWSIQTIHTNDDDSSLKFTIGKRYTPGNQNIDTIWITPSIEVDLDMELLQEKEIDSQREKAIEYLLKQLHDE